MSNKKIVIIGAGISGLSLAERLSAVLADQVILVEREKSVGGLAGTQTRDGFRFDLGSHRLHIKSAKSILKYIENIIGESLLSRERRGKLYFQGKFISYPPNIYNLLKVYSTSDIFRSASRYLANLMFPSRLPEINFETAMIRSVGWDIYNKLYYGYAKKLWGIEPKCISIDGMHKRKTVIDLKSLQNALKTRNYFLYPSKGIGDIAKKLEARIIQNGGIIFKNKEVGQIQKENKDFLVYFAAPDGQPEVIKAERLISTIPIDEFYGKFFPERIENFALRWRGVRILYIYIDEELNSKAETYYFPSQDVIVGRLSEIKKYSPFIHPGVKGTWLTLEIPASKNDSIWDMPDKELLQLCINDLLNTKILIKQPQVKDYFSLHLDKAYPVYEIGWREKFFVMYDQLNKIDNLFSIGRGGLFLHSNIDHSLLQGIRLAEHILKGSNDKAVWDNQVKEFLTFSARD